jgi:predicted TIM-barrel fold metal-dependent hydrolase
MTELAKRPNVMVKLGGQGQNWDYPIGHVDPPTTSTALATKWKPWIETTIELFGVQRCMFESNFPVDKTTASYDTIWNAFKRITASASAARRPRSMPALPAGLPAASPDRVGDTLRLRGGAHLPARFMAC